MLLSLHTIVLAQHTEVDRYPVYTGNDLGCAINAKGTQFRFWSPGASAVRVLFYRHPTAGKAYRVETCTRNTQGTWTLFLPNQLAGHYYTLRVKHGNTWTPEFTDPYSIGVGTNGKRSQIIQLANTHPDNWYLDHAPQYTSRNSLTDAIIYEAHVRDLTIDAHSGVKHKGKFIGLTQTGTRNTFGQPTALDHIRSLGVTHVHLLPVFDFHSIQEDQLEKSAYNWGYDPAHYNTPEGSYSINPADGHVRIREFKRLVQAFHRNGIRVVMDVVYNHTALSTKSNLNYLVPGYYYRQNEQGEFSNGSGCGNELATERIMVRKFIQQSLRYWMQEYHVDGFRFDLMGLHDVVTMQEIADQLRVIKPDVLLYGEGWTGGSSPLAESDRALKKHAANLNGVAVFGDDLRDAIKGNTFHHDSTGFVSGNFQTAASIRFGLVGAGQHPQIAYGDVNYSKAPFTSSPQQHISYAECHDNHTLWDKLALSRPDLSDADRLRMHQMALAIVLTAQGVPFLHAGTEFARSKQGVENSYNAPDSINAMRWNELNTHHETVKWVRQLIQLRKAHPAFRMATANDVATHLEFIDEQFPAGVIGFRLHGEPVGDSWPEILVIFNANAQDQYVQVPDGNWQVKLTNGNAHQHGQTLHVTSRSVSILAIE